MEISNSQQLVCIATRESSKLFTSIKFYQHMKGNFQLACHECFLGLVLLFSPSKQKTIMLDNQVYINIYELYIVLSTFPPVSDLRPDTCRSRLRHKFFCTVPLTTYQAFNLLYPTIKRQRILRLTLPSYQPSTSPTMNNFWDHSQGHARLFLHYSMPDGG